jgi:hypothetical protein
MGVHLGYRACPRSLSRVSIGAFTIKTQKQKTKKYVHIMYVWHNWGVFPALEHVGGCGIYDAVGLPL